MIYRLHHAFGGRPGNTSVQDDWLISGEQPWVNFRERRRFAGTPRSLGSDVPVAAL